MTYHGNEAPPFRKGNDDAFSFASEFRRNVGNCPDLPEGKRRKVKALSADDLFCFGDVPEDEFELVDDPKSAAKPGSKGAGTPDKAASEADASKDGEKKPPIEDPDLDPPAPSKVAVADVKKAGEEELARKEGQAPTDARGQEKAESVPAPAPAPAPAQADSNGNGNGNGGSEGVPSLEMDSNDVAAR